VGVREDVLGNAPRGFASFVAARKDGQFPVLSRPKRKRVWKGIDRGHDQPGGRRCSGL